MSLSSIHRTMNTTDVGRLDSPKPEYDDETNRRLEAQLREVKKICRERLMAYVCVRSSLKYLVMKEDYEFPKVTAYCALGST